MSELPMIERVAKAIDDELARQHSDGDLGHYHPRSMGDDWNAVDGNILVTPLARAVLQSIRDGFAAKRDAADWMADHGSGAAAVEASNLDEVVSLIDAALTGP